MFKKNFKVLGFRSPDWQRAKLLIRKPLTHVIILKDKISRRFFKRKDKIR